MCHKPEFVSVEVLAGTELLLFIVVLQKSKNYVDNTPMFYVLLKDVHIDFS